MMCPPLYKVAIYQSGNISIFTKGWYAVGRNDCTSILNMGHCHKTSTGEFQFKAPATWPFLREKQQQQQPKIKEDK